jgi:hypothetical protein
MKRYIDVIMARQIHEFALLNRKPLNHACPPEFNEGGLPIPFAFSNHLNYF